MGSMTLTAESRQKPSPSDLGLGHIDCYIALRVRSYARQSPRRRANPVTGDREEGGQGGAGGGEGRRWWVRAEKGGAKGMAFGYATCNVNTRLSRLTWVRSSEVDR